MQPKVAKITKINTIMTKKRIKENLEYITQIEQDMLSKGKRIAPRLYVVKRDLQKALGYEVAY